MEMFELRYFVAVADTENLHSAGLRLGISPPALSKAINRLESETGAKLFQKKGRHIYLTTEGQLLKERASQILRLAENAQRDLKAVSISMQLRVVGPESLLAYASQGTLSKYTKGYASSKIEFGIVSEELALNQIRNGTADIAFITGKRPADLRGSSIGEAHFSTFVGPGHELYDRASKGKVIPVEEILKHPFVVPDRNQFGRGIEEGRSSDGWRDDKFSRQIQSVAPSLFILTQLVREGKCLAYIPDYLANEIELTKVKVSGCPYFCTIKIFAIFRENLKLS